MLSGDPDVITASFNVSIMCILKLKKGKGNKCPRSWAALMFTTWKGCRFLVSRGIACSSGCLQEGLADD